MRSALLLTTACFVSVAHGAPAPADTASRLAGTALLDEGAFAITRSLTDEVGPRRGGTPDADRAVAWALAKMKALGLANVHLEAVKVPRWRRGVERVELLAPRPGVLHATALGHSPGTPPSGVEAEVVEVRTAEELAAIGDRARGRILLVNRPMQRTKDFSGYAAVAVLRRNIAVDAARAGAVAALFRSAGTGEYRLPHTGATHVDAGMPAAPVAAISAEDADLLDRLLAAGQRVRVRVRLDVGDDGTTADSANVVGEVPGRERTKDLVLLGAHLDSWDLGEGALDDAAGVGIVLEAARLMLRAPPRRTVRVVLFMNEENGIDGGFAYAKAHAAELASHVAALESDAGAGPPTGIGVAGGEPSLALVRPLVAPLAALRLAPPQTVDEAGADLIPMQMAGVPVLHVAQDVSQYFDWHHTAADTLDKVDTDGQRATLAAFVTLAWQLAEMPARLPKSNPPPK